MSMAWAQVFPFVALIFFEGDENTKSAITIFLVGCLVLWSLLNIAFFCTIDLNYLSMFIGTTTAPQYAVKLYKTGDEDQLKFDAIFSNRLEYTQSIHVEVKEWIAANINQ